MPMKYMLYDDLVASAPVGIVARAIPAFIAIDDDQVKDFPGAGVSLDPVREILGRRAACDSPGEYGP